MSRYKAAPEGAQDVRRCDACGTNTFHDAVQRMVFSASGARMMWLWQCENHPLPEVVSDTDDCEAGVSCNGCGDYFDDGAAFDGHVCADSVGE